MAKQSESILAPYFNSLKFKLRRKTMLGRATNVLEALEIKNRFNQEPKVIEHGASNAGYFILYHLPEGISKAIFEKNIDHFNEQLGGKARFTMTGRSTLRLDIITFVWEKEITYNFTPGKKGIELPVGYDVDGNFLTAQLDEIYHILINGTTGGGKSNILSQWAYTLIQQGCVVFFLDLMKKDFAYLKSHAFVGFDLAAAQIFFRDLNKEMDRRLELQAKYDVDKVADIHGLYLPRIVLMIDELGDVLLHPKLMPEFNRLARGGRAPEISIIAANQRNDSQFFGTNWAQTRHLFLGALCFPVKDRHTSEMILGNDLASKLKRSDKGRAIWQYNDDVEVQTMYYPSVLARTNLKMLDSTKGGVDFAQYKTEPKKLPIG